MVFARLFATGGLSNRSGSELHLLGGARSRGIGLMGFALSVPAPLAIARLGMQCRSPLLGRPFHWLWTG